MRHLPHHLLRGIKLQQLAQRYRTIPFGQALAFRVENQGNVNKLWRRLAQQAREISLPRGGAQQIIAADYLVDSLVDIVYHHRQVISPVRLWIINIGNLAAAPQDEIVDVACVIAMQLVLDGELICFRTQPQRWHAALRGKLAAFLCFGSLIKIAAGARILPGDGMRGARGFLNVFARTEAS